MLTHLCLKQKCAQVFSMLTINPSLPILISITISKNILPELKPLATQCIVVYVMQLCVKETRAYPHLPTCSSQHRAQTFLVDSDIRRFRQHFIALMSYMTEVRFNISLIDLAKCRYREFNPLAPKECGSNWKKYNVRHMLWINLISISCEITLDQWKYRWTHLMTSQRWFRKWLNIVRQHAIT